MVFVQFESLATIHALDVDLLQLKQGEHQCCLVTEIRDVARTALLVCLLDRTLLLVWQSRPISLDLVDQLRPALLTALPGLLYSPIEGFVLLITRQQCRSFRNLLLLRGATNNLLLILGIGNDGTCADSH
jgi:hypothetical protein